MSTTAIVKSNHGTKAAKKAKKKKPSGKRLTPGEVRYITEVLSAVRRASLSVYSDVADIVTAALLAREEDAKDHLHRMVYRLQSASGALTAQRTHLGAIAEYFPSSAASDG